jgi:ankyrin repeat protein
MKIQDLLVRLPHMPEKIFQKLDCEGLFKCRKVARFWLNIIDERNYPWLRIVNIPTILKERHSYLHLAAETGQIEAFKGAFNQEEDKDIKNECNETPFHLACGNGRTKIVELLIKKSEMKVNVNAKDNHAFTSSVNVNAKCKSGNTAFHFACLRGHLDVVKILMENAVLLSIDLNIKNNFGKSAFAWGCNNGHTEVVHMFMKNATILGIDLNAKDNDNWTGFHLACERGHANTVKIDRTHVCDGPNGSKQSNEVTLNTQMVQNWSCFRRQ